MALDAVIRNLEVIGEAATRFDADFRAAHSNIPWRNIIGTRNILIHAYDRVVPDVLVSIVERDIPALLKAVLELLEAQA